VAHATGESFATIVHLGFTLLTASPKAGCTRWEYYREGESDASVTIRLRCECGQFDGTISMSLNEFAEQAGEVLRWRRLGSADQSTEVDATTRKI
jgi:hypothetical protein